MNIKLNPIEVAPKDSKRAMEIVSNLGVEYYQPANHIFTVTEDDDWNIIMEGLESEGVKIQ